MRTCLHCGSPLTRKRYNGRLESNNIFQRRRYCDVVCSGEAHRKADAGRQALGLRARRHLAERCERCGTTEKLSIHHKDRDWRNNDPQNLATLCSSCHTSLHHDAGEIVPRQKVKPCRCCGRDVLKRSVCETCRSRIKRHGSPFPNASESLS